MGAVNEIGKLVVTYRDRVVGEMMLAPDDSVVAFQYDKKWLANGFSISPLELPLKPDVFVADYKTLLHLTGYLTQSPSDVEQMFRRMVFNVLIENKDDHAKNFSFICDEGKWRLAPAYDILPFPEGYRGQHATSVLGQGNPSSEDMIRAGESIRIKRRRGQQVIEEMEDLIHSEPKL